jgi:hypothetical protein
MGFVEKSFNINDYYVIAISILLWIVYFFLPLKLSKQMTVMIILFSITVASVFDNSFGALAFDFYDIMDGPDYTVMDLAVYFLYPPFGLYFVFLYKKLKIHRRTYMPFIFILSILAVGFEWISHEMNVFSYKNGYGIKYSFFIYIMVQSVFVFFYKKIQVP